MLRNRGTSLLVVILSGCSLAVGKPDPTEQDPRDVMIAKLQDLSRFQQGQIESLMQVAASLSQRKTTHLVDRDTGADFGELLDGKLTVWSDEVPSMPVDLDPVRVRFADDTCNSQTGIADEIDRIRLFGRAHRDGAGRLFYATQTNVTQWNVRSEMLPDGTCRMNEERGAFVYPAFGIPVPNALHLPVLDQLKIERR